MQLRSGKIIQTDNVKKDGYAIQYSNMYTNLKEIVDFYHYNHSTIANYADIEHYIVDLFNHGESSMETNSSDSKKLIWNGTYYRRVEKDYKKMKKYYEMAIDLKNANAMNNLGYYYQDVEKDYEKMKKCYEMSIELNNATSMNNLGTYYHTVEKDYDKMKKYYLMAIELKNAISMTNLGYYYQYVEKDYDKMKKYYLMAIELNEASDEASDVMGHLGYYYQTVEKDYEKMKKYYLMADMNFPKKY